MESQHMSQQQLCFRKNTDQTVSILINFNNFLISLLACFIQIQIPTTTTSTTFRHVVVDLTFQKHINLVRVAAQQCLIGMEKSGNTECPKSYDWCNYDYTPSDSVATKNMWYVYVIFVYIYIHVCSLIRTICNTITFVQGKIKWCSWASITRICGCSAYLFIVSSSTTRYA